MSLPPIDYQFTSSYSNEQPLLPAVRTNAFTQVPPAKKITFYKSGDPKFAGIKMAINQRSFKSFNALMDDLSHRIPLPFGVRAITTPRGIHFISTLDQLEDGGCYLCSDKKYATPLNTGVANRKMGPQKVRQTDSVLKKAVQDIKQEDYSMAFTQQSPRIPKKITLIKNGDITTQLPIILNRRNAQSFKILLDEISEIMQFTVRKLYTIDGKRIDSMQGLLLCPNVLICAGQEPFKPILMQNPKKHSSEKLPGLASHANSNNLGKKNEMNFGLKAKKSVIHPRSSLSNRSMRFSLSSEKSYVNGLATSPENRISSSNSCPNRGGLVPSLVNDDIEKKVYMNKDGSLAVEMKVCFHLLSDETLQWSTQIKKSGLMNQTLCEESDIMEDNQSEPREKINQETSFEMEDSLYPCDADSYISNLDESENEVTYCHCCSKSQSNYDIWKNPMHASQKEEPEVTNTWYTHSSCSSTSSHQRIVHKKRASIESIHTSSNERKHSECITQETSDSSETLGNVRENARIKKCCCQDNSMQKSKNQKELSEKMDDVASLANSENEHGSIVRKEGNESRRSRARSNKSKCQYSIESQIKVLEETSSVVRTISSSSITEREEVTGCSSPSSACSKFSKCSTFGTKEKVEKISDNDHIPPYNKISSCSSDDCPPKIVPQVEVEKEDEDNNEMNSISEKMVSNSLIKDEFNRCSKRSKTRVSQSKVCNEEDRSDSSEMDIHSAALSVSRIFSGSKCNQYDSKSKVSSGSSRGSTIKRKKTKGPLHVDDGRSSSGTTYSSENSSEVGKRDKRSQLSHNSSHSNVSSLSKAAANSEEHSSRISKCYSKSSRSSHKRTQSEDTEVSTSVSNVLESDEKNGANTAKNSTQEKISRQGNSSESMCSNCGHIAETRNNYLQCASSKNLLHSDASSEMQASENNDVSSQSSISQSSKPRQKKRSSASLKYCSQVSEKVSTTQFNFHSPVPPKGRPSSKNSRSLLMNINSAAASDESEPTADELKKEMAGSQLPEMDTANEAGEKEGSGHEEKQIEEETVVQTEAASETCDQIIPSSLPNASPEEVVHEWLRKIPSESLLMKCEMEKDEETTESHAEIPNCSKHNQDSLQEERSEKEDAEDCEHLAEKDCPQDEQPSEIISEEAENNQGECQYSDIPSQNHHKKDLPNTIQISVQIMKALLASKHETKLERSYSLPEVSPTLGKNLSNSANILIQCLATLQLLDEELDPSNKQNRCLNWFRYKELLNIFQAVWFGNMLENGDANLGLQGKVQIKTSSSFKDPNSKDSDFTAMTSSGIDLSSGDGGSGEESGAGAHDCALLKEKRDKAKFPEEGKPEQEDGNEEEPEEHSQPLHSKLESESEAELAGVQEVIEAKEDQDRENDTELDKNSIRDDQNVDDAENVSNEDDTLMEAHTDTVTKEVEENPSEEAGNNETEPDSSVNEATDEKEAKIDSENQSVTKDDTESSNISHQSTVKVSPMVQQRSGSQDPVWVLKLLKKIEKEFMTHYVSAMNEFKVKWNLTNSEELDLMIAELKEEVSRRIQKSVEEELNKIKSRTGKKIPKPPKNELKQESTPELENRRRRLTSMLSFNYINVQSTNSDKQLESGDIDKDDFFHNTIEEDERYDDQLKDEEYCPCEGCMRKKMVARTAQRTAEVMAKAPNPVLKAFDLQEILRMKNTSVAQDDINEAEPQEEAQQAAKETVESDGKEEAKHEEGQEEGREEVQEEGQEEEGQEVGQEKQKGGQEEEQEEQKEQEERQEEEREKGKEEEQEEKQEEGQEEEEEQEEGQEEQEEEQEDQEVGQEEGQEEQEKEGQEQEEQEEEEEEEEQEEEQEKGEEEQEQEGEEEKGEEEEKEGEQQQEEGQEEQEQEEGQQKQEEEQEQEEQQESVKGEREENEEEEKPNIEDEEKEGEPMKEDEKEEAAKQEDEEKSETESVKEKEEEEENETEEDIILGEPREGKEDEEQEKEVKVEQDEQQGEKDVIYEEDNQETEAKSEGDKELNDKEEMDGEQKETPNDDQEAEHESNATDISAIDMDEKESQGDEPAENVGESQAIIEEEIPDSSEQKSENNASLEVKSEACSETTEVEEEDKKKEGDEPRENEAEGEDSSESVQNPEDDRGTQDNGAPGAPAKRSEGIFSQQSQEGSEHRSDEDESKKKENISNEDSDCGSDGESKLVIENKPAKMYPDSNEDEEDDQSSQTSIVMEEDPPNEDNEDSHRVSKKKKQNSNVIDQDDLDF